jgi:hypothetical protein
MLSNNEMNPTKGVEEAGAPRPLLHQCALRGLFQCYADLRHHWVVSPPEASSCDHAYL